MQNDNKFYVNTEYDGFDQKAYARVLLFAGKLANQDKQVKRLVCYVHTKGNTGYFEPFFDEKVIKRMLDGSVRVEGFAAPFTIATKITYATNRYYSTNYDVVLAFGMNLKDLAVLNDYDSAKYTVAIPWLKDKTMPWVKRWTSEEISGKKEQETGGIESTISEIVREALKELSSSINMTTGITNPFDNDLAKTYVRALHKYEKNLNADDVASYLVSQLGWTLAHANDVGKLITTLNKGRYFRGGEKTGVQKYYKHWKNKVSKE